MNKKLPEQNKKTDAPSAEKGKKIMLLVIECAFLAFCFSTIALLVQGYSMIFVSTLGLSVVTLLYAIMEYRRFSAKVPKDK